MPADLIFSDEVLIPDLAVEGILAQPVSADSFARCVIVQAMLTDFIIKNVITQVCPADLFVKGVMAKPVPTSLIAKHDGSVSRPYG